LDEVQAFYDKNAQNEWDRLDRHKTEFAVTLRLLKDYLPHLPAEVLDVGGVRADILSQSRSLDSPASERHKSCTYIWRYGISSPGPWICAYPWDFASWHPAFQWRPGKNTEGG